MARPPSRSAEDKIRIVLAVLRGELSVAEAARRDGVSQTSIANWRDQFLDGGQRAVAAGGPTSGRSGGTPSLSVKATTSPPCQLGAD